jgi:hypothetical protein
MKHIPLINGGYSVIDDDDYELVNQFKWRLDPSGYAKRTTRLPDETDRLMHRLIMNTPKGMLTDHRNGEKLDNRRENLRVCTNSQNTRYRLTHRSNKNGLREVCYCDQTGKWKAYATQNGKQLWLGRYDELQDAINARDSAVMTIEPDFSIPNSHNQVIVESLSEEARRSRVDRRRKFELVSNNTSGYRGVSKSKRDGNWRAYIGFEKQHIWIASTDDPTESAYIYDQVALQLRGDKAVLNLL